MREGTRLGPYEILSSIGAGGMGEVYRAADTKLKRHVALKLLPEAFAGDAGRMARFQREAELLAALNHPHIAAIYGVEEFGGGRALVMELAEGETLAERIQRGPLPLPEALDIAGQIAAALEYAHEKGIVHRDLKPANVKVTPEGAVKVLDFGLAKALGDDRGASADAENSPTLTFGATQARVILGTAAYMAPEQARGKAVDKRADIWAFGVLLYEMVTGKRLFRGEDMSEILAAVIKEEPRWETVPARLRPLLQRCLEKDPRKRLRDIGDAMPLADAAPAESAPAESARPPRMPWAAAAACFLIAAATLPFAVSHLREKPPMAAEVRFEVPPPPKGNFDVYLALSPDGRRLAHTATGADGVLRIWVRDLDKVESRPIEGTENAQSLFWSPDSRFLAFGAGNQLKKVDVTGGPPITLCDSATPVGSGAWSRNGTIVFGGRGAGPMQKVAETGGVPSPITMLDRTHADSFHSFPFFLPDGSHFVYFRAASSPQYEGVYIGSLKESAAGQNPKPLLASQFDAIYAASPGGGIGNLLFLRDGTLMAQPFDPARLALAGEPVPVAEQVGSANQYGNYSASLSGTLAFRRGGAAGGSELVWMDRAGKRLETVGKPGPMNFEALSPDGRTVAYVLSPATGTASDVWLYDFARGTSTRFTFRPGTVMTPIWSPDSSRIAYGAQVPGGYDIYEKPASGAAKEQLVLRVGRNLRLSDWSRDGKTVVYSPAARGADLYLLPMEGDHKPSPYLQTQFEEFSGQFSPDGRWMSYTSNESGQLQVYVQPVPPTGAKWQISTASGNRARWRRDGKELFYIAPDQNLMAVPIKAGAAFEAGIPQALFRTPIAQNQPNQFLYTPSPDGQKFLMRAPAGAEAPSPITVVLNWQAGLRK